MGAMGAKKTDFPPLPPADQIPIIINSPPVKLPENLNKNGSAGKILFVPTIIYPHKKRRVIVHHSVPFQTALNSVLTRQSVPYFKMMEANPYYADLLKTNPYYTQMAATPDVSKAMTDYPYPKRPAI